MNILAIDTSGTVAAVAVGTGEKLLANYYIDDKLTHSQKLLPMIDTVLKELNMTIRDVDVFACVTGPGSFTGLRIGVATVKGMALSRPVAAVSATRAMAYGYFGSDRLIMPVIDARNENIFTGAYKFDGEKMAEIMPPSAINVNEIKITEPTIFMGDGSVKYKDVLCKLDGVSFAPPHLSMGSGANVYMAALEEIRENSLIPATELVPFYIKKCQAEQEKERNGKS